MQTREYFKVYYAKTWRLDFALAAFFTDKEW